MKFKTGDFVEIIGVKNSYNKGLVGKRFVIREVFLITAQLPENLRTPTMIETVIEFTNLKLVKPDDDSDFKGFMKKCNLDVKQDGFFLAESMDQVVDDIIEEALSTL